MSDLLRFRPSTTHDSLGRPLADGLVRVVDRINLTDNPLPGFLVVYTHDVADRVKAGDTRVALASELYLGAIFHHKDEEKVA